MPKKCDKPTQTATLEVDLSHTKEGSHIHSRDIEVKKPVLSVEPNQDKAARKGYKNTREVYHWGHDAFKLDEKDQENENQRNRNDYLKAFCSMNLLLVSARKFIRDTLESLIFPWATSSSMCFWAAWTTSTSALFPTLSNVT